MNRYFEKVENYFEELPNLIRKRKFLVWIVFILTVGSILAGSHRFRFSQSQVGERMFAEEEPARRAAERNTQIFGSNFDMVLFYEAKDGNVFSQQSLQTLKEVQDQITQESLDINTKALNPLKHATQIRSIINTRYQEVDKDHLISREFIGAKIPQSEIESQKLKQQAMDHPEFPNTYVSKDGRFGTIVIRTDFRSIEVEEPSDESLTNPASHESEVSTVDHDPTEYIEVGESVDASLKSEKSKYKQFYLSDYAGFEKRLEQIVHQPKYEKHLKFYKTPWGADWEQDEFQVELIYATAGMIVIMVVILLILFKSFSSIVWSLIIVLASIGSIVGIAGWFEMTVEMTFFISVSLVLVVSIADSVHILSGYMFYRRQNEDHENALRLVYKKSGLACFLTSITTSIGMLSLVFLPIVSIKNLGILAAIGVIVAFLITIFVLPVMLDLWSPKVKIKPSKTGNIEENPHFLQYLLRKIDTVATTNPKKTILVFMIPGVFLFYQAFNISVDTNYLNQFLADAPIRKTLSMMDDHMSGTDQITIMIETEKENSLKNPLVLNHMEKLEQYVSARYPDNVVRTFSLVNLVKYTYQNLNEGSKDHYRIPQDPTMLEQILFLFNNANPTDRRYVVTDNYSCARIVVSMKHPGSDLGEKIVKDVREQIDMIFQPLKKQYPDLKVTLTGDLALNASLNNYVSWSQLRSFGLAFLVISLMFIIIFGSLQVGLISIIPNSFPIIVVFGIMGWIGISLDQTTLMIAPIMIGIVVDDTIHFVMHYRSSVIKYKDIKVALSKSIQEVGQAITFTSIILFVCFFMLLIVSHRTVSYYGLLSAIAVITALLADLFLLPALLKLFNARYDSRESARTLDSTLEANRVS